MKITKAAEEYYGKMFPGQNVPFAETDPKFTERFVNFVFDKW